VDFVAEWAAFGSPIFVWNNESVDVVAVEKAQFGTRQLVRITGTIVSVALV
jgi:hypothetical protein